MKFRDSRVPCGGELTYDIAKLLKEVAQTGGHGIALVVPGCSPGHVDRPLAARESWCRASPCGVVSLRRSAKSVQPVRGWMIHKKGPSRSGRSCSRTHMTRSRWGGYAPLVQTDERVRSQIRHPKESQAHGPHESPTASCAPARSNSQRSRTEVLRCGFTLSRIRAEISSGPTPVGPRRITRVSHGNHQLGGPSRTRRL